MTDIDMEENVKWYFHHRGRLRKHYANARKKHPYFCDTLDAWGRTKFPGCNTTTLKYERECIAREIENHNFGWDRLLLCEMWEVFDALSNCDKERAVEELYDCISVLLRTIDVLEGRQKLGKVEKK